MYRWIIVNASSGIQTDPSVYLSNQGHNKDTGIDVKPISYDAKYYDWQIYLIKGRSR